MIESLYALESMIPLFGSALAAKSLEQACDILARRTELYSECFPGMALVGFPDFERWEIDQWIWGLLSGPMGYGVDSRFEGKAYLDVPPAQRPTLAAVLPALRDLQYIRPRFLGTIEFRADGAVSSPEAAIALAAWRLGQSLIATSWPPMLHPQTHSASRRRWEAFRKVPRRLVDELAVTVLDQAAELLRARGFGEERYLKGILS